MIIHGDTVPLGTHTPAAEDLIGHLDAIHSKTVTKNKAKEKCSACDATPNTLPSGRFSRYFYPRLVHYIYIHAWVVSSGQTSARRKTRKQHRQRERERGQDTEMPRRTG